MVKKLNEEEFDSIFQSNRKKDRLDVGSQVWDRLEDKLDLHSNNKTKHLYRNWAIASSFLVLVSAGIIFTFFIQNDNSKHFLTNGHYTHMEDLGSDDIHFAEISNISKLYDAYSILDQRLEGI